MVVGAALAGTIAACSDDGADPTARPDDLPSAVSSSPPPVVRPAGPAADLSTVLEGGNGVFVGEARKLTLPSDWVEEERVAAGTATSYQPVELPADGRYTLSEGPTADYRTRILVRRPKEQRSFNGTVVVEWLNVSGGVDGNPGFSLMGDELIRGGYAWVGVSAQFIGVEGGPVAVSVPASEGIAGKGLRNFDPPRYATLHHPGDAFSYDTYTQVARALRQGDGLGDLRPDRVLAIGQSQSAAMLVTYANGVQPQAQQFDGFLIHSRGAPAAPLGATNAGVDVIAAFFGAPTTVRDDLEVPVLVLQTETDVLQLGSVTARQGDTDHLRLWEIAGAAHADRTLMGATADTIDCGGPVNDGPQRFIARAALRALDRWARTGEAPPHADRLSVEGDPPEARRDNDGIILGGIRTPVVDAPVVALSGQPRPASSAICFLSGATDPISPERLTARYGSRTAYVDAFTRATDAAITAGFVLPQDRDQLLAAAQPDLIPG